MLVNYFLWTGQKVRRMIGAEDGGGHFLTITTCENDGFTNGIVFLNWTETELKLISAQVCLNEEKRSTRKIK